MIIWQWLWWSVFQRGHYFAFVDEVGQHLDRWDRTPLSISGPASEDTEWYYRTAKVVRQLLLRYRSWRKKIITVTLTEIGEVCWELLQTPLRDPERPEDILRNSTYHGLSWTGFKGQFFIVVTRITVQALKCNHFRWIYRPFDAGRRGRKVSSGGGGQGGGEGRNGIRTYATHTAKLFQDVWKLVE